jgi:hypothetical protein
MANSAKKLTLQILTFAAAITLPFLLLWFGLVWDHQNQGSTMEVICYVVGLCLGTFLVSRIPKAPGWKFAFGLTYLLYIGFEMFVFGAMFVCSQYKACM